MFGYSSDKSRHDRILNLLLEVEAGKEPVGYGCAAMFMFYHPDWEKEIKKEEEAIMAISKENPCASCGHFEVCGIKDKFLSVIAEVRNSYVVTQNSGRIDLNDLPWLRVDLRCIYFKMK
jgi:hypothetical protein